LTSVIQMILKKKRPIISQEIYLYHPLTVLD